jgi:hypothetical protein
MAARLTSLLTAHSTLLALMFPLRTDYHLDFIQQDAMRLCSKLNRNIAQFHAFLGEQ